MLECTMMIIFAFRSDQIAFRNSESKSYFAAFFAACFSVNSIIKSFRRSYKKDSKMAVLNIRMILIK